MTTRIWGEDYVRRENMALRRALGALRCTQGRLLEVGCGAGRFVRTIVQERADFSAFGSDLSVEATQTGARYPDPVRFAAAPIDRLPYLDGSFDVVLLFDVLEHVPDPDAGLQEIARVLRPGGLFHALVPCEGQPGTLHWLLWRLGLGGDLKERHGAHIQRFTRRGVLKSFYLAGLTVTEVSYSMHPFGQLRDVLVYVAMEPWFRRWRLDNLLFAGAMRALWAIAYVEAGMFRRTERGAAVLHVTAVRRG